MFPRGVSERRSSRLISRRIVNAGSYELVGAPLFLTSIFLSLSYSRVLAARGFELLEKRVALMAKNARKNRARERVFCRSL